MVRIRAQKGLSVAEGAGASKKAEMAKELSISLKAVVPVIPRGAEEKNMLEEELQQMGCHRLLE